jgi:hypothetical protein
VLHYQVAAYANIAKRRMHGWLMALRAQYGWVGCELFHNSCAYYSENSLFCPARAPEEQKLFKKTVVL